MYETHHPGFILACLLWPEFGPFCRWHVAGHTQLSRITCGRQTDTAPWCNFWLYSGLFWTDFGLFRSVSVCFGMFWSILDWFWPILNSRLSAPGWLASALRCSAALLPSSRSGQRPIYQTRHRPRSRQVQLQANGDFLTHFLAPFLLLTDSSSVKSGQVTHRLRKDPAGQSGPLRRCPLSCGVTSIGLAMDPRCRSPITTTSRLSRPARTVSWLLIWSINHYIYLRQHVYHSWKIIHGHGHGHTHRWLCRKLVLHQLRREWALCRLSSGAISIDVRLLFDWLWSTGATFCWFSQRFSWKMMTFVLKMVNFNWFIHQSRLKHGSEAWSTAIIQLDAPDRTCTSRPAHEIHLQMIFRLILLVASGCAGNQCCTAFYFDRDTGRSTCSNQQWCTTQFALALFAWEWV